MSERPQRVFVHVGVPKTGTTFLQTVLAASREALGNQDVLYPGSGGAHFRAAQDLTEQLSMGRKDRHVKGAWRKLARQSRRWSGTVVISHELFTLADIEHIQQAVEDLTPAEVHAILTVRDFERQVPAAWQARLKNGGTVSFGAYFDRVVAAADAPASEHPEFWRQQDAAAIMARWAQVVPGERVHVITVPQSGAPRDALWRRFAQTIGVDASTVDLSDVKVNGNMSLRPPQALLLRRVNERIRGAMPDSDYQTVVKRYLSSISAGSQGPATYSLTAEQAAVAHAWSERLAESIVSGGYTVVGDVEELTSAVSPSQSASSFDDVTAAEEAEASVATTAALIKWLADSSDADGPVLAEP